MPNIRYPAAKFTAHDGSSIDSGAFAEGLLQLALNVPIAGIRVQGKGGSPSVVLRFDADPSASDLAALDAFVAAYQNPSELAAAKRSLSRRVQRHFREARRLRSLVNMSVGAMNQEERRLLDDIQAASTKTQLEAVDLGDATNG